MKKINRFIIDFAGVFVIAAGSVAIALAEVITQIIYMLQKFFYNVLLPFAIEFMADVRLISLIAYQSLLSFASDLCLNMSKWLLKLSEMTHNKSEQLIHKCWID